MTGLARDPHLDAIRALEQRRADAIVAADVATLERITDPDYVHVEASGAVRTREAFLSFLTSGAGRFERYVLLEIRIRVFEDAALVTGAFENAFRRHDGGLSARIARHSRVWARRDGVWRNVSHQATAISG